MRYEPEQGMLMPPDIREWLPEGHLALFISDVVEELDLGGILGHYERGDGRGRPPYHPLMMVKLLMYGYCIGKVSSRKMEQATYDNVAFRVLACNQHPDHDSIANFRRVHLSSLAGLFVQVLKMCERAGLVKLGHVSIDGSKLRANASKHKAMSYERMCEKEEQLAAEVEQLLRAAAETDAAEDAAYGKGVRGDDLPAELARRESRLVKIREAKASLEAEATEQAKAGAEAALAKIATRKQREEETGKKPRGPAPKIVNVEEATPKPTAQRNFTDPESRIMKDGATGSFEQSYNGQIAVDDGAQIIVAATLTQDANDKQQLVPVLKKVKTNTGRLPEKASADAGYFSTEAVTSEAIASVDLYVPPNREKKTEAMEDPATESPPPTGLDLDVAARMREKLKTESGRTIYAKRKTLPEPVFGQIKEVRGFRRFSFRGLEKNDAEWSLICLTHNLLKLFRGRTPLPTSLRADTGTFLRLFASRRHFFRGQHWFLARPNYQQTLSQNRC